MLYCQKASVFISLSVSDAGPYTVLEAMACEVPIIVSDHCGVSELIDNGVDSIVYRYDDIDKLASQLKWLF